MLKRASTYEEVCGQFEWDLPHDLNLAWDICGRHALKSPNKLALVHLHHDGREERLTFSDLERLSSQIANMFEAHGIKAGDRVLLHLSQSPMLAAMYIALWKLAAIPLPVSILFGADALSYRLADSGSTAIVTDSDHIENAFFAANRQDSKVKIFHTEGAAPGSVNVIEQLKKAKDYRVHNTTNPNTPGLLIYTSGTTGQPKGALHGHRVGRGHTPAYAFYTDFPPHTDGRVWSPADWTWIGGIGGVFLPSLFYGMTIISTAPSKFDPEWAFQHLADQNISISLIPPTALKLMRSVPSPETRFDYNLTSVYSGGESLGAEALEWGHKAFGLTVAECYGQTECNLFLGTCPSVMEVKPGAIGLPTPGRQVGIIDDDGHICPPGKTGDIAIRRGDPCMMIKYWRNPEATEEKFRGDWMLTGDLGQTDEDGYYTFFGRNDDVITSAGYRIGPGEIEDCLMMHPDVSLAAAIGVPDPVRTEVVKAFLVLKTGRSALPQLEAEIREHVRSRLAAHEYPRLIEFLEELPLTVTGKIKRRELRDAEILKLGDPK